MNYRREKALKISLKEAKKEKRGRLTSILTQKLLLKHGVRSLNPLPKQLIREAVIKYLCDDEIVIANINLRDVDIIVEQLSAAAVKKMQCRDKARESEKKVNGHNLLSGDFRPRSSLVSFSGSKDDENSSLKKIELNANPWIIMETFKVIEAEETLAAEKAKAVQKRQDMASALHEQIRMKEQNSRLERSEDDKFLRVQNQQLSEWKTEQLSVAAIEKEKILQLRQVRQDQIEERNRKRKSELEEAKSRELKEIEDLKHLLMLEEKEKRHKKELEIKKWEKIKLENAEKLRERERLKNVEAAMDAKLMLDMKNKLELEEAKREKAIEDRMKRAEFIGQQLSAVGAFNRRDHARRFERSLLLQAQEREKAREEEDKIRKEEIKRKKMAITQSNIHMALEKKRLERDKEREEEAYALQCTKEKHALLAEKEALRMKQVETKKKYSHLLNKQIEEKKRQELTSDKMTCVERSINKKLMAKIESDQNVRAKILEKLHHNSVPILNDNAIII